MSPSDPSRATLKSFPRKSIDNAEVTTLELFSSIVLTPEPEAPASVPQENFPEVALYKTVFASSLHSVKPSWNNPRETLRAEVDAKPEICNPLPKIPPAKVEVALDSPRMVVVAVRPIVKPSKTEESVDDDC